MVGFKDDAREIAKNLGLEKPPPPNALMVIVSLTICFAIISGIASFLLGPIAVVLAMILVLLQILIGAETLDHHHPSITCLMLIWLFTEPIAAYVGSRNHQENYVPYLLGIGGRRYSGISAADKASAHMDGGVIEFASDALLDESRAVGYRGFGHIYCAAPILSTAAPAAEHSDIPVVEFWAVGVDCCGQRGTFKCNDAGDRSAHGGVVMHDPEEEGMSDMASTLIKPRFFREGFGRAIAASSALNQIQSVSVPVLVTWSSNPDALIHAWYFNTNFIWLTSIVVYAALVTIAWCLIDYYFSLQAK